MSPALPPGCSEVAAGQSIGCVMTASGSDGDGIGRAAAAESRRLDAFLEFLESLAILPGGQRNNSRGSSRFQRPTSAKTKLEGPEAATAPLNLQLLAMNGDNVGSSSIISEAEPSHSLLRTTAGFHCIYGFSYFPSLALSCIIPEPFCLHYTPHRQPKCSQHGSLSARIAADASIFNRISAISSHHPLLQLASRPGPRHPISTDHNCPLPQEPDKRTSLLAESPSLHPPGPPPSRCFSPRFCHQTASSTAIIISITSRRLKELV